MKLSVIVPVYNVEPYLPACLDALLEQGLPDSDYEIICVDDGSTDRGGNISEDYARRCRQITVIHQENGGLSAARNTGLRAAAGEYVYFCDSDDVLCRNVLGALYDLAAERGLDQLLFDYEGFSDGEPLPVPEEAVNPARLTLFQDPMEMRGSGIVPAWRAAWNYLVRRSVLREYGLEFLDGILFEDQEFNFWLDRCAARCGYLDQKLYYYRHRENSILRSFMSDVAFPRYIRGRVKLAGRHQELLRAYRAGNPPKLRVPVSEAELEDRMIDETQGILNRLLAKGDRALFEETLTALRARELYPYPLRWRRLLRKNSLKKRLVDAVSYPLPLGWYLRLCLWIRMALPGKRSHISH